MTARAAAQQQPLFPQSLDELPIILSYGMGLESTTILLRWLEEPASRDFPLQRLIVITAMTGDEHESTARFVRQHVLPRLRAHRVRFVQVARAGPLRQDGIVVLDDSQEPTELHIRGAWRLSQEMETAGTIPQFAKGQRRCSIKFKGEVLDAWMERELGGRAFRHVMGFNATETKRVERDCGFSSEVRHSEYPLGTLGWGREECDAYVLAVTGEHCPKSCCTYCPFAGGKRAALERLAGEPEAAFQALRLEHVAMALNPRSTLYSGGSLRGGLARHAPALLASYDHWVAQQPWAVYRVRRIMVARGKGMREVTVVNEASQSVAHGLLASMAQDAGRPVDSVDGLARVTLRARGEGFPALEEAIAVAPARAKDKARAGFAERWSKDLQILSIQSTDSSPGKETA